MVPIQRSLAGSTLALAVILMVAPASAQIFLPGTQPGDIVHWDLLAPGDCKACHWNYDTGPDYEPFDTWAGSMMANAARDPLFWAAVDIANQDAPGAGELCIRCHSPRGWLAGRSSTPDGSALTGYPDEPDNDFEGVDCHFCHRMYEGAGGTPFLENGQYWVDDGTALVEPDRRGPYNDAFAPHPASQSAYHASSEFCAVCHDLRNPLQPLLDETGVDTGLRFPEQISYTEWLQSDFEAEGVECQDCHMPPAIQNPAFACSSFNPARPNLAAGDSIPVYRHDLAGANTFIPRVLKGLYGAALGREDAYDYTLAQNFAMLQQNSATVAVTNDAEAVAGDSLSVSVRVTNLAGHKLPTGYPEGRRMWLYVEAADALGIPFFTSGAYDTTTATREADTQLRTYEVKHGVHGQGETFHLVLNNQIVQDTRIPPRGFRPNIETQPVGRVYAMQPDSSLAHWDDASYRIPVPASVQGPVRVTATLRYQTTSKAYIDFLKNENISGPDPQDRNYPAALSRGDKIYNYWSQYGKSAPVDMATDLSVVPVKPLPDAVNGFAALPNHNQIRLSWSPLSGTATGLKILRKTWGGYPDFGSSPASLPAPGSFLRYDDSIADGWVEVYDGAATSYIDTGFGDGTRDIALYAAYSYDVAGTFGHALAGSQSVATSYRLGDLGEIGNPGVFDGQIDGVNDLPIFSAAFGSAAGGPGWNAEVDIAPTHDGSSIGYPLPDDVIDFDDLVMFSLQYGSAAPTAPMIAERRTTPRPLILSVRSESPGVYEIESHAGGEALHALSLELPTNSGSLITRVIPDSAWKTMGVPLFAMVSSSENSTAANISMLGAGTSLQRDSKLARIEVDGTPLTAETIANAEWIAVDELGGHVLTVVEFEPEIPNSSALPRFALSQNVPNPFNPRTVLELSTDRAGLAEVAVYDVTGRRVKTLLREHISAGRHPVVFDGTDHRGQQVASGIYLVRASGQGLTVTRRIVLIR